jgi:ParB family chromosome partitioning protein
MEEKKIVFLDIEDVIPNRFQPRIKFNEVAINELANSIKKYGVIQPIVVRPIGNKYEIIAGERRYKASLLAGKIAIPAIISNLDDRNSAEVALIENIQRQDLTPIEEAISYKKILDMGYLTQTELALKIGKEQSTVANKLRLLNLSEKVQDALMEEKISERHARSLLRLDELNQEKVLEKILKERMTVRRTDEEIDSLIGKSKNVEIIDFDSETARVDQEKEELEENYDEDMVSAFVNVEEIQSKAEDIFVERPKNNIDFLLTKDEVEGKFFSKPINEENTYNFDSNDIKVKYEVAEKIDYSDHSPKTLMDVVKEYRSMTKNIQSTGKKVELEEMDFENTYQIIIKIEK